MFDYSAFLCIIVNYGTISKRCDFSRFTKKKVLLAGPRQAGKTTLAKQIAKEFSSSIYLTYDRLEDRKIKMSEAWLSETELIISWLISIPTTFPKGLTAFARGNKTAPLPVATSKTCEFGAMSTY